MYIFFPSKNHSIFQDHTNNIMRRSLTRNISNTINAMRKLGAKIYQIDPASFSKITKLTIDEKIKFLELHRNN